MECTPAEGIHTLCRPGCPGVTAQLALAHFCTAPPLPTQDLGHLRPKAARWAPQVAGDCCLCNSWPCCHSAGTSGLATQLGGQGAMPIGTVQFGHSWSPLIGAITITSFISHLSPVHGLPSLPLKLLQKPVHTNPLLKTLHQLYHFVLLLKPFKVYHWLQDKGDSPWHDIKVLSKLGFFPNLFVQLELSLSLS